jgi:PAS domain S-box-containing protein
MPEKSFPWYSGLTKELVEKRRREIERSKREFFEEAKDGFYISTREGEFLDCNLALVRMLGYESRAELLSLDLNTELWVHAEDRPRFQAIIEKQGFVEDYEGGFMHKSGRIVHVSLSSNVWRDEKGEIRGYRGFVVDRTEQKHMHERLAALDTKYRDLFDNMQDGVFIFDNRGTVIDCNDALCLMVGHTRKEFLELDYYEDLFVNADQLADFTTRCASQGTVKDLEVQMVRKDGTVLDVSMSGYATRNTAGRIIGYQGLVRDITEAKRLRRQLIRSEKLSAMGRMASQLAHELNNPIYGIMNCLELLRDVVPKTNSKRRYLDLAVDECKRTSGLLLKMLKFFKPDQDRKSPTQITKLLEETLLFYEKQLKNQNIRVIKDLDPNLPLFMAVESQLKQVFINMIINANTAMPSGGQLRVATRFDPRKEEILVSIEDTGVGIPPHNLDRIFEAFFTTKKEVKGVGLGLSICFEIVKHHGGRIEVKSEPNTGTTFTLIFPYDPDRIQSETDDEKSDA